MYNSDDHGSYLMTMINNGLNNTHLCHHSKYGQYIYFNSMILIDNNLSEKMSNPDIISDMNQYTKIAREHKSLDNILYLMIEST